MPRRQTAVLVAEDVFPNKYGWEQHQLLTPDTLVAYNRRYENLGIATRTEGSVIALTVVLDRSEITALTKYLAELKP